MSFKYKLVLIGIALAASFATGRYSVGAPQVKTSTVATKDTTTTDNKDIKKTITIVKQPSGVETTTITEDTIDKTVNVQDLHVTAVSATIPPKVNTLNISVLAGLDPQSDFHPMYGLSVQKQFLGPISAGVFGFTNGTIGLSIGLNF